MATGVSVAQKRWDGSGISIAVMDTGVNYKHPVFGGCKQLGLGSNCRVRGGYDFMGNTPPEDLAGGLATANPDSDPMECSLNATHGTQVASVAAGDATYDKSEPWRGVAYKAGLLAYKVTGGCKYKPGAVSTAATLQAIRQGTKAGADVMNLSWGDFRGGGYADANYSAALTAAMKHGALVAVAAGNYGLMGPFFTEGGVAASDVLSVASVDVNLNFTGSSLLLQPLNPGVAKRVQAVAAFGPTLSSSASIAAADRLAAKLSALKLPTQLVLVSPVTACGTLSTPRAQLQGKVALVMRGTCYFHEKIAAVAAAGASAVIVFSNPADDDKADDQFTHMNLQRVPEIPVWGLTPAQTKVLQQLWPKLAANTTTHKQQQQQQQQQQSHLQLVAVKPFDPKPYKLVVKPSSFSSWGPSVALDMLPSIAAPGRDMQVATAQNGFTSVEGTSFAAPYVAGALALWRQAHSSRQPAALLAAQAACCSSSSSGSSALPAGGRTSSPAAATQMQHAGPHRPESLVVEAAKGSRATPQGAPAAAAAADSKPLQAAHSQGHKRRLRYASAAARTASASSGNSRVAGATAAAAAPPPATARQAKRAACELPTLQQAAYAAFVSTAQPVPWRRHPGWAQPVARVGAGLIQVDAAIQNPTVVSPNHFLLRSNQATQTLSMVVTNTAPFAITYTLGHLPAAAVLLQDLWFEGDQEDLLYPVGAQVQFSVGGKPSSSLRLVPGQAARVQVMITAPQQLRERPFLYSGYLTLTPATSQPIRKATAPTATGKPPPAQAAASSGATAIRQAARGLLGLGASTPKMAAASTLLAVQARPLVVPYQGFSQNYTTLPLLPPHFDAEKYPKEIQDLKGLLHVCYARHDIRAAFNPTATLAESAAGGAGSAPEDQDGSLGQKQVWDCQHSPAHSAELTAMPMADLASGRGVAMVSAALLRPAVRMSLMLFDTDDCSRVRNATGLAKPGAAGPVRGRLLQQEAKPAECSRPGSVVGGYKGLVGEVWRYRTPSRDYPGSLWAYYAETFKGNVTLRDPKTDAAVGEKPVQLGKVYRLQVWILAPLAAADKAAGDQYKLWKFDIPGGFKFV